MDSVHGDQLKAAQRRLDSCAIGQRLGTQSSSHGWVEGLEEARRRVLEDGVDRRLYVELRVFDEVVADAEDGGRGTSIDVAIAVEAARGMDLLVPEIGQGSWRPALGRSVTMTVEDVDAQHGLLCVDQRQQRREEELFREHLDSRCGTAYLSKAEKLQHGNIDMGGFCKIYKLEC